MSKEAIKHYEAALKEAFPSGATGDVFHHWNEARKAVAEQPAQGCDYCNHPQYAGTKCKNCGREQPAQQESVAKPYAYEYGRNNGDGTYSVIIERGDLVQTAPAVYNYVRPRNAHKDWPIKELFDRPQAQPAQPQEPPLQEQLDDALQSLDFYRRRVQALQQWQSKMRDPERTIVCDIIANGCTLEPAGDRYKQPAQQEPVSDRENAIIRFALHQFMSNAYSNMNAAAQDKDSRHYTVGAVEKFAKDAKDAEALLSRLQFKAPKPAQQEPCGWQFFQYGKWHNGMETNDHRANTEAAGVPVRDVYPSPPAQRKPLTDEQRNWIVLTCPTPRHIIDTVEKMHGIKEQP